MQEEVTQKTVALIINTTKFSGKMLMSAIKMFMNHRVKKKLNYHGKQTIKQLVQQGKGVSSIEIQDDDMKHFQKLAKKYGVDYAIKKSDSQYLIFFKAQDADAMTALFEEYTNSKIKNKESIFEQLNKAKEKLNATKNEKAKDRDYGARS